MLQAAALEAVRSARYRPYMLDHQPTEVETTFSINFRLGS
jgi:protein TonB